MSSPFRLLALATLATLALQSGAPVTAQTPPPGRAGARAPTPAVVPPRQFASAEEAVQAFVAAVRADDTNALLRILGSEGRTLVSSGDPVADRRVRALFVQSYDEGSRLMASGTTMILRVGKDDWPFPIPLVVDRERWRFDVRQGREEIIARRVGRNELNTMQVVLAYVDAQRGHYAQDRDGDGVLEYAQRFASSAGTRDGLYWPSGASERPSPLGDLVAQAQAKGYQLGTTAGSTPFHGYLFRILTGQGDAARDGAYDYVVRGHMIAGFGMVAFPAQYGVSGVMTFIVNHDGVVHQKDLGPTTTAVATAMRRFNPDASWSKADVH
jgi:hypothetical protein